MVVQLHDVRPGKTRRGKGVMERRRNSPHF